MPLLTTALLTGAAGWPTPNPDPDPTPTYPYLPLPTPTYPYPPLTLTRWRQRPDPLVPGRSRRQELPRELQGSVR